MTLESVSITDKKCTGHCKNELHNLPLEWLKHTNCNGPVTMPQKLANQTATCDALAGGETKICDPCTQKKVVVHPSKLWLLTSALSCTVFCTRQLFELLPFHSICDLSVPIPNCVFHEKDDSRQPFPAGAQGQNILRETPGAMLLWCVHHPHVGGQ